MTNEQNCKPGCNCNDQNCNPKSDCTKKSVRHVLNADFAFIALTVAVVHSFVMVYSIVFLS